MIGKARGDIARSADDASGDGVANGDGDAKAYAKDLEELAAFFARMSGSEWRVGGERVRRCGQCAVPEEPWDYGA